MNIEKVIMIALASAHLRVVLSSPYMLKLPQMSEVIGLHICKILAIWLSH